MPPDPAALERSTINTSDRDARSMKRAGGRSVQGYNVQVVASEEQLIVAARRGSCLRVPEARVPGAADLRLPPTQAAAEVVDERKSGNVPRRVLVVARSGSPSLLSAAGSRSVPSTTAPAPRPSTRRSLLR
jgi:hypothetical protein